MNITIRKEREDDYHAVENLTREAFWNLYVPGCDEHYLTHLLRGHPDFLPELDLVAELDGKVIGNIMYTKARLVAGGGTEMDIAGFGPVCVLPEYQRKGIGGALIRRSLTIAKDAGIPLIVILGYPHNYCKHGFKSARDFNISDKNGEYPYGMLTLELIEGSLDRTQSWKYQNSPVYDFDPAAASAFDAAFPPKEKRYEISQELFSIAVRAYLKP